MSGHTKAPQRGGRQALQSLEVAGAAGFLLKDVIGLFE